MNSQLYSAFYENAISQVPNNNKSYCVYENSPGAGLGPAYSNNELSNTPVSSDFDSSCIHQIMYVYHAHWGN